MAKVDSVERLITGEKGIWMDLQEKPACCPCIFPPPYFKVFKDQTDSDMPRARWAARKPEHAKIGDLNYGMKSGGYVWLWESRDGV